MLPDSAFLQAYASPEAAVLMRLFVKLLGDYLNEIAYDAELAGLSWGLNTSTSGFLITFFGCLPLPTSPFMQVSQWCDVHRHKSLEQLF